jgi:hypothetical protein
VLLSDVGAVARWNCRDCRWRDLGLEGEISHNEDNKARPGSVSGIRGDYVRAGDTDASKVEVGLNYSWLHVNSANYDFQRTGNVGSGYAEYNITRMIGLVADLVATPIPELELMTKL